MQVAYQPSDSGEEMSTATAPEQPCDRDELTASHLYLVQHIVNQLASRYPRHVDRGELWSAGAFGLVDASRRYDPATGIPFGRYAAIRIRGAIIDSTRTRDWATRALRREMRTVRDASERFEEQHGRSASSPELAELLGITTAELASYQSAAAAATLLHLDYAAPGAEPGESTFGERIEERQPDHLPEEAVEHRELIGTVRAAVEALDDVQRDVVERSFFNGELLRDIADSLGVTEARASQIRTEAVNAMRAYFGTTFEGVPAVADSAPGLRRRAAYVATMSAHTTWRTRLEAGADPHGEHRTYAEAPAPLSA